ncbi:MAG: hypothetical protein JWO82_2066, partial [Akkermansiaceae bacterium]|nr:hypothetical protein [Akkermansiaceae bacterium]
GSLIRANSRPFAVGLDPSFHPALPSRGECVYVPRMATAKRSLAAAWYLTGIGLVVALAGAVFTWLMWRSFSRAEDIGHWAKVPCVILKSEAEQRQIGPTEMVENRFAVLYGYQWQGQAFNGDRWKLRGSPWLSRPEQAEELEKEYPVGLATVCLVDPANPASSVLEPESKAPGYSIWFPLLFVVGGGGMILGAWKKRA